MTVIHTKDGEYTAYYHGARAKGYTFTQAIINLLTLLE